MIKAPDVTLLYVLFAFLVSYAILKRFLFRPLSAILEARESEEKTAAKLYAESLEAMEKTVAEAQARLSLARREALKDRESLRGEGRERLEKALALARTAATASIEGASADIGEEARRRASELPERARALARTLAEKVLGRKLAA